MRICTYNIHSGRDAAGRPSLAAISATLRAAEPDLCLLQEVDRFLPRSGFQDQAQLLAAELGANVFFYGRLALGRTGFGNAILTRRPARAVRRVALPGEGEPRCALSVTDASGLALWNTHLGLREPWRARQLARLGESIEPEGVVVLGGDFNTDLSEEGLQNLLAARSLEPVGPASPTFPAAEPRRRIDFLFGRGVTVRDVGTIAGPGSDHCLVWAEVDRAAPAPPPPAG